MRADREPARAGGRGEATPEKQVAPGCSKQESCLTLGNAEHPPGGETGRSWTPRGPDEQLRRGPRPGAPAALLPAPASPGHRPCPPPAPPPTREEEVHVD